MLTKLQEVNRLIRLNGKDLRLEKVYRITIFYYFLFLQTLCLIVFHKILFQIHTINPLFFNLFSGCFLSLQIYYVYYFSVSTL